MKVKAYTNDVEIPVHKYELLIVGTSTRIKMNLTITTDRKTVQSIDLRTNLKIIISSPDLETELEAKILCMYYGHLLESYIEAVIIGPVNVIQVKNGWITNMIRKYVWPRHRGKNL